MVVAKLRNSFSRVAIAQWILWVGQGCLVCGCLGVCKNDLPWVQSWTRGILVYYSQLGYLCVGS